MNAGSTATTTRIPLATSNTLAPSDKLALTDGTRLIDQLTFGGAPATATITGGTLVVALPAGAVGIYAPIP